MGRDDVKIGCPPGRLSEWLGNWLQPNSGRFDSDIDLCWTYPGSTVHSENLMYPVKTVRQLCLHIPSGFYPGERVIGYMRVRILLGALRDMPSYDTARWRSVDYTSDRCQTPSFRYVSSVLYSQFWRRWIDAGSYINMSSGR